MLTLSNTHTQKINSPVRSIFAKVELFNSSSTLVSTYNYNDALISYSIERVGDETKFFGYGICQKINVKLRDVERSISITTDNYMKIAITSIDNSAENYVYPYPIFYVSEVNRNENNNELSITAYDSLYKASNHTVSELNLTVPYTIGEFATACATLLGLSLNIVNIADTDTCFDISYDEGANFDGTETIRDALNAVAEATQTIYYINNEEKLTFKRLDLSGNAILTIDKSKYFSLNSKTNRRLATICHATELGDNVSASITESGSTQYIRNNPFWDLRDDIETLVNNALAATGGLTINQFDCSWRGNYSLEIGDKISLITKDNNTAISYVLNDTISYDGGLSEKTKWSYSNNDVETASNPTTIGDALKQTYARVDKANKQIELVASENAANSEKIANMQIDVNGISAEVKQVKDDFNSNIEVVNGDIQTLTQKVNASMTAEDVKLQIQSELNNGVTKVETTTGFTFNDEGLTVSKSGSEMTTQITEDGMTVYRDNTAVLIANNVGVDAVNLHATTYLIIGTHSRFEDYGEDRTGCFWIGN